MPLGALSGQVAVVTGASRGLGAEIARALAERGVAVASVARGPAPVGLSLRVDIGSVDSVERLRREVEAKLGPPAILVNAAGIFGPIELIAESDPDRWIGTLRTNTVGPYLTCRAFVGGMVARGYGRIVNVSSAASLHPPGPLNSAYATSKLALNQLTRHLAAEVAGTGVTANVIHPGDVKTEMWADIREQALSLGERASAFSQWVDWVEETGGDPPGKAVDLVLRTIESDVNGRFLWIDDPLQPPIPSWDEPAEAQPWLE